MLIMLVKLLCFAYLSLLMNSYLKFFFLAKLQSFATNAAYFDIRRRAAKLGEYFQAALRVVATCLSLELHKYRRAIAVEQVCLISIFIPYFGRCKVRLL